MFAHKREIVSVQFMKIKNSIYCVFIQANTVRPYEETNVLYAYKSSVSLTNKNLNIVNDHINPHLSL